MNWFKNFIKRFQKKTFPKTEHKTSLAFIDNEGTEYFEFDDPMNIPADRGNNVLTYYKELELGITRNDLKEYLTAIEKALNPLPGKPISITSIATLTTQLNQKVSLQLDIDVLWKIASVVYFDKSENPGSYDYDYAKKKIEKWKNDFTIDVFFSTARMLKYLSHTKLSEENIKTYLELAQQMKDIHAQGLSEILKHQSNHASVSV